MHTGIMTQQLSRRQQQRVSKGLAHRQTLFFDNSESRSGSVGTMASDDSDDGGGYGPHSQKGCCPIRHRRSWKRTNFTAQTTTAPSLHHGYPDVSPNTRPSRVRLVYERDGAMMGTRTAQRSSPPSSSHSAAGQRTGSQSSADFQGTSQSNALPRNNRPFVSRDQGTHGTSGPQGLYLDPTYSRRGQGLRNIPPSPDGGSGARRNRSIQLIEDTQNQHVATTPMGPRSVYFIAPNGDPTLQRLPDFKPPSAAFSSSTPLSSVEHRRYAVPSSVVTDGPAVPRSNYSSPPPTIRGDSMLIEAWSQALGHDQSQPAARPQWHEMDVIPPPRPSLIDIVAQASIGWLLILSETGLKLLGTCLADTTLDARSQSGERRRNTSPNVISTLQPHATPAPEALSPLISTQYSL